MFKQNFRKERMLVTCPECGCDQHIYAGKIVIHNAGIVRCTGSKMEYHEARKKELAKGYK